MKVSREIQRSPRSQAFSRDGHMRSHESFYGGEWGGSHGAPRQQQYMSSLAKIKFESIIILPHWLWVLGILPNEGYVAM